MTPDGQLLIPREIRQALQLKPGQKFRVSASRNQELVIKPVSADISSIYGMFKADRHVAVEDMSAERGLEDDLD
jgi:AbrB family looped-hinge helix DNA binding protein